MQHIVVATDSLRVAEAASGMAVIWVDAADDSWCGGQRIARALLKLPSRYADSDVIVYWEPEEPDLQAEDVDRLILYADEVTGVTCDFVTATGPYNPAATRDPTRVKAHYDRPERPRIGDFARLAHEDPCFRPHVGVYAFRPERVADLLTLPPSARSIAEQIEPLTWIEEHWVGEGISVLTTPNHVDSPQDYRRFVLDHARDAR